MEEKSPVPTIIEPPPEYLAHDGEKTLEPESQTDERKGTPVSLDVLFPLLIFSVVIANPPHLVSHVLYTQRLRSKYEGGGEESYCIVNFMAVVEFLESVDLGGLGLGGKAGSVK